MGKSFQANLRVMMFLSLLICTCRSLQSADLRAEAQLLQAKPDVSLTGNFEFNARPAVLDALLKSPMLVARLWEANGFTPKYKVRMRGDAIHVDDPTGIQGDLYPMEQTGNRRVWIGMGNLNHALVPSFKGRMALVLTTAPKGSALAARVALYIRTDSRFLGFLTSTFFPLVRARVEHRMTANAADIGTILAEVSSTPQKAAARLSKEDSAALLQLVAPPPAPVQAAAPKTPPADGAAHKAPTKSSAKPR